MTDDRPAEAELSILLPVFNDWVALGRLLGQVDAVLAGVPLRAHVLVVDDGSTDEPAGRPGFASFAAIDRVEVLHLRTGRAVRVGNFSVVPRRRLESLVATSELWNHYAAAAFTSRQPYATIPATRARRLDGRSKMNFVALVAHGLSAMSVYGETIGVRLLLATLVMIGAVLLALGATLAIRLTTDLAIPGWATTAFGVLLIVLLQATLFLFVFSFMVLAGRGAASFLPNRDYIHFVGSKEEVYRR